MPTQSPLADEHPLLENLTPREREVLAMIGQGLTLPEIAERLYRSLKTIETHRLSLGRKLNASNRVALARIAIAAGLAPLHPDQAAPPDTATPLSSACQTFQQLEAATHDATGATYFRLLVEHLEQLLHADLVTVSQCTDEGFHLLAASHHRELLDPARIPSDIAPCNRVSEVELLRIDQDFHRDYPRHPALAYVRANAYLGICLRFADRSEGGLICVYYADHIDDQPEPETVLRLLTPRASAELERTAVSEQLRQTQENLEDTIAQRTRELERSETHYRTLVETMSDGLCAFDENYRITFVNQRLCDMIKASKEQLVGRDATDFMPLEDANTFLSMTNQRTQGTLERYQIHLKCTDNTSFPVIVAPRSFFNPQGQFQGAFGVITELPPETEV